MENHGQTDHSQMKLGRRAVKTDSRTLKLSNYVKPTLPPAPPTSDWTRGVTSWGLMLNDHLGDCTIAGIGHAIQVWSANTGTMVTVPDPVILSYYEKWDGYNPANPATDTGGIEMDVLKDWQKQGFDGHKLIAFADPVWTRLEEIRQAIHLFGGVYIGLNLPLSAQTQDVWDVIPNGGPNTQPGTWGGHCVFVPAYDQNGFTCITWGMLKTITNAFWNEYVDEAHALLSQDWLEKKGSPTGFDLTQLQADLSLIH